MSERWGARAVADFSHLPSADNPALPKQAPGAATAGSRHLSFPARPETAPVGNSAGSGPWSEALSRGTESWQHWE